MKRALIVIAIIALSIGCASTSKRDCELYLETAANVAIIIADNTAKKDDRAEAVTKYAEIVKGASGLGCSIPPLAED